jgi:hypothetical protein
MGKTKRDLQLAEEELQDGLQDAPALLLVLSARTAHQPLRGERLPEHAQEDVDV